MQPEIKTLETSKLIIDASYKPDADRLASVVESVKARALLHPPCVTDQFVVFAGELHVLACKQLAIDKIDCNVFPSDLTSNEYKEIAVHKNLQYPYLTWDEQIIFERELHLLRQATHGPGKKGSKDGWSIRDTAEELHMAFGVLSEDIRMADAILADPTLRRIKDKSTARRVILGDIKRQNQEVQASAPAPVGADYNCCIHGGSEAVLRSYPDNTFDCCVTDPPWLEYRDRGLVRDEYTLQVFKEVFRVLKVNSFLFAFVSHQDFFFYETKLREIGYNVQKYPMIWVKENVLTYGTLSWNTQRNYEPILVAVKGAPAFINNMVSSIISCPVVHPSKLVHPNEKPKEVIKKLLLDSTFDNALIIDPFAGSFVVADVCRELRRRYVAIEINKEYYDKGVVRLSDKSKKVN